MLYSKNKTLQDSIVEAVTKAPKTVKLLHEELSISERGLSPRAVYKAVTLLTQAGVLIKAGKWVRIDQEWLRGLRSSISPSLNVLNDGERLSYVFNSIQSLDAFWKTAIFEFEAKEEDGQIFFYNPHNFWAYIPERRESENTYYRHFDEEKLHAFFTVGGDTSADRTFKKEYQNEYLQIDTRNIYSISRTDHITIYGDHVITVRLSKEFAQKVDRLYATTKQITEIFPEILALPTRARLTIEHNPAKAAKLKKLLSTNFYFRKGN